MRRHSIAVIPGDGIGTEVVAAGCRALEASARRDGGFELATERFDWGFDRYKWQGSFMPADGVERLKRFDTDARRGTRHRRSWVPHPGPRRRSDDGSGHAGRGRGDPRRKL